VRTFFCFCRKIVEKIVEKYRRKNWKNTPKIGENTEKSEKYSENSEKDKCLKKYSKNPKRY